MIRNEYLNMYFCLMIQVDGILVADEVIDKKFVCDLNACKGACCVLGDSGAPLEAEELEVLEDVLEEVMPYMNQKGRKAIEKFGPFVIDADGDYTTTLVAPGKECAFVFFDEKKIAKCAIEMAYLANRIKWKKPISCHLYPIRINKLKTTEALNYSEWHICKPACECGEKLSVQVYKFLREPLERKYGTNWYKKLDKLANEQHKAKNE